MQSLILVHPDKAYADSVNQSLACRFEGKLTIVRSDSCEDALRYWLEQQMPDIILTAADLGDYSGMELYREARSHDTRVRVILLADVPDTAQMMEAIRGGAEDYILREEGFERIADAVQRTMQAVQAEAQAAMTAVRTASARPLIDRDILHRLMAANHQKLCAIKAEMDIWHYPCRNHQPVALGCCFFPRLDFPSARARMRIEHMASPSVELIGIEYDDHTLVVMCYTREGNPIHILKECLRTMCTSIPAVNMPVCLVADRTHTSCCIPDVLEDLMDRLGHADSSSGDVQCVCTHCRQDLENDEKRRRHWDAALEVIRVMRDCLYDNQQDQYFDEEKRLKDLLMSSCLNNNDRMLLFQSIQMMLWGACEFLPETDRMLLRESSPLIDDVYSGNIRLMFDMAHESARWVFSVRGGTMSDELHRWLARINGYIMQHLSEDLSLTTLAEQFDYHPVYLSRLYKHASGIGLMEYITDIRLKRAFILLQSSGKSVAAIAGELGFSTSNYFSRWFRKKTGQSPQEYREAYSG